MNRTLICILWSRVFGIRRARGNVLVAYIWWNEVWTGFVAGSWRRQNWCHYPSDMVSVIPQSSHLETLPLTFVPAARRGASSVAMEVMLPMPRVVVQQRTKASCEVLDAPVFPFHPSSRISDVSLQKEYLKLHWRYPPLVPTGRAHGPVLAYREVCASCWRRWGLCQWYICDNSDRLSLLLSWIHLTAMEGCRRVMSRLIWMLSTRAFGLKKVLSSGEVRPGSTSPLTWIK